jgi:2-hydroxychromene-2-carboxylate isomerase
MAKARVDVYYSLQSDYCYFLLDRLLELADQQVDVVIKPVLGGVLRIPERYSNRDALEQSYFVTDTTRLAAFLGLPYAYPDPSPITFRPGSLWVAENKQPRNEHLYRLFVGSVRAGRGLAFLDTVGRMLWDGSTRNWDQGEHLRQSMQQAGLNQDAVLEATSWQDAQSYLEQNATDILNDGHWGVPLMVYEGEPFYGQDRFDHLQWRMKENGVI